MKTSVRRLFCLAILLFLLSTAGGQIGNPPGDSPPDDSPAPPPGDSPNNPPPDVPPSPPISTPNNDPSPSPSPPDDMPKGPSPPPPITTPDDTPSPSPPITTPDDTPSPSPPITTPDDTPTSPLTTPTSTDILSSPTSPDIINTPPPTDTDTDTINSPLTTAPATSSDVISTSVTTTPASDTGTGALSGSSGVPAPGLPDSPSVVSFATNSLPPPTSFVITATTTQSFAPIPTASVASDSRQSTVQSTDQRIQYSGNWTSVKSSCESSVMAMESEAQNSYFTYRFKVKQGGAVYLDSARGPDAGVFVVILDNLQAKIDGYSAYAQDACAFTWFKTGLDAGFHNLTTLFDGPSPQSPTTSPGSFQLNGIQLTAQDTTMDNPNSVSLTRKISSEALFFSALLFVLLS